MQFATGFGFAEARAVVPYLARLSAGALYASPIFAARGGSEHGYDVIDPTRLNPELGDPRAFDALARELRRYDLGLLLDIVPNHMAASAEGRWWRDVLRRGRASRYAGYFDIDWDADPDEKLVLPILGRPYAEALEAGEIVAGEDGEGPYVCHYEHRLPLDPATYDGLPADLESLDRLLGRQRYRLVFWRSAAEQLNYRRFFDITGLVGVRVEEPAVFDATHRLAVRLARQGRVTGLRVDHVDGLRDPTAYLRRLRERVGEGPYLVVEKILVGDEALPDSWPVDGTTGYDFLNQVNAVLIDEDGLSQLTAAQARFTGSAEPMRLVAVYCRRSALVHLFSHETVAISRDLARLARRDRLARDLTSQELTAALLEVTARFPVYRTYGVDDGSLSDDDRRRVERAVDDARRGAPALADGALDLVRRALLLELPAADPRHRDDLRRFVSRWQQLAGPAAAKGFEDTALYVHHDLLSLNEVGADPAGPRLGVAAFHERMIERRRRSPRAMNATSTHDTKRSEDVRARIDVISEMPGRWARAIARWRRMNAGARQRVGSRSAPSRPDESLLYQTLVGAWPLDDRELPGLGERLKSYVVKAAREAKTQTSWLDQNAEYERALRSFVDRLLGGSGAFLEDLRRVAASVAYHGALNSLSQTLLKVAAPGVPDFYQGTELWDLSLVDPDNRRPVDFGLRAAMLSELDRRDAGDRASLQRELLAGWRDGRVKLYVTSRALAARRAHSALFLDGDYVPLPVRGAKARHLVAFARRRGDGWAIAMAPRLTVGLTRLERPPIGRRVWRDTAIDLPAGAPGDWVDALSGVRLSGAGSLLAADALRRLPVALLLGGAGR